MFKTLYGKIAAVLFTLFLVIGILYVSLTIYTTRLYIQEGAQRLNFNLADYLVSQMFFIKEGEVNEDALKKSFDMLMGINPGIELYLLDPEGNILAYSDPSGKARSKSVSVKPLKRFLSAKSTLPILGDDPRDSERKKVFSVAPVPKNGPLEGYLYVILGGEEYDSIANMLRESYILRLSTGIVIANLLFVLVMGLFVFNLLTRRLKRLSYAMENFKQSDFHEPAALPYKANSRSGDEINQLGVIFSQMSHCIIEQMNSIREADRLRRELMGNISHDLRTPLSSLHGYLETLLMKGKELSHEEQQKYLKITLHQSEKLGKLVSELFELAKLDSKEMSLKLEPFHPGELVQDILHKYQLDALKKRITVQAVLPEHLPFVYADIGLIERAIDNLMDNALRYTDEGGNVTVTLVPDGSKVTVKVTNTGRGISPEDIPFIFDRFYRKKAHAKEAGESAGLGLAITKRILDLHGSSIEVESELNASTTFIFALPVYRAEPSE
jgi:signal transduction histidine kinase